LAAFATIVVALSLALILEWGGAAVPPLSWLTGLAFDTKRRGLMAASISGAGSTVYHYTQGRGNGRAARDWGRAADEAT
jgi:hypothetical protein